MKKLIGFGLLLAALPALAQTPAQKAKIDALLPAIKKLAAEPAVVKAIKEQNDKKVPLTRIKKLDADWVASSGITDEMRALMDNECAAALKKGKGEVAALSEAFAMDNQGALACTINKTSDYWQGDEDKFQKSYARGKGADFIDKPSFDDSSQSYSVQVSVPVLEGGKAIGAITVGLALDRL